jgi:hypothetical protein
VEFSLGIVTILHHVRLLADMRAGLLGQLNEPQRSGRNCSLLWSLKNPASAKNEAGLDHQVDQHRGNIQQRVDDHEVRQ